MKFIYYSFLIAIFTFLLGCESENIPAENFEKGYEYYPITVGSEWIYRVDSTIITGGGSGKLETSSLIRETITEQLENDGVQSYLLRREIQKELNETWTFLNNWTVGIDESKGYRTEDNLTFIKMVFPPLLGSKWDGHVFFDDEIEISVFSEFYETYRGWEYEISEEIESIEIQGNVYSNALRVSHIEDDQSLLEYRKSEEIYAPNAGMIYRRITHYQTQNLNPGIPWEQKAENGFDVSFELVSYTEN